MADGQRVALVTGSNRGLGYGIVKGLVQKIDGVVFVLARKPEDGKAAIEKMKAELGDAKMGDQLRFHQCDVTDVKSLEALRDFIVKEYKKLDIMVHNSGVAAFKGDAKACENVVRTNYYGTRQVCDIFLPIMKENGRVVNIASRGGFIHYDKLEANGLRYSEEVADKLLDPNVTVKDLDALVDDYLKALSGGSFEAVSKSGFIGVPHGAYMISKAAQIAYTRVLGRDNKQKGLLINAMCPGFVKTDMTHGLGDKTIEEGADTAVYLATLTPTGRTQPTGQFWADRRSIAQDWPLPDDRYIDLDPPKELFGDLVK